MNLVETSVEQKAEFAMYGIADTNNSKTETQEINKTRRPFDEDIKTQTGIGGEEFDVGSFFVRKSQGSTNTYAKDKKGSQVNPSGLDQTGLTFD